MSDELIEQLRGKLNKLGVKYHHSHNAESLEAMLAEAEGTEQKAEAVVKPKEAPEQKLDEPPVTAGLVKCRVTKWGHNQISTGDEAKPFYKRGDFIHVPAATAASYEKKYFAETIDD